MYKIYVVFKCFDGKRESFVERVRAEGILNDILAEDGCLGYNYYFSEADKNELLLIEAWESKKHQEIHIAQPHMDTLRSFKGDYITSTEIHEYKVID